MTSANATRLLLTKSQTSLWLADKLNPNTPLNNVPYAFYINGELDFNSFQIAFNELIKSTDVLRIIIGEEDSLPYQEVREIYEYQIEFQDFSEKENGFINNWLQERSEVIFDIKELLFDTAVIKLNSGKYIWYLNLHHLITDAQSSVVLFDRMSQLYKAILENNALPISNVSYSSFVQFEQKERINNQGETQYWEHKLEAFKELPNLYGEKASDNSITKSNRIELELTVNEIEKLKAISNTNGVKLWNEELSLFNVFATLLFTYLYRVSGQSNLVIGAPIHNRVKNSFKETAGLFIEIFPLAVQIEENDTFFTLLKKVQIASGDYLKYGVTGASSAKLSRGFNVVLNYITAKFSDFAGFKTEVEWIHPNYSDPGHKLRFHVFDFNNEGNLKLVFDFNDSVLNGSKLQEASIHFKNIYDTFLDDIHGTITKSEIVTKQETQSFLLEKIISTEAESVLKTFENLVHHQPNAVAVQEKGRVLTFRDLNKKSNQLAHFLVKKGVKQNTKVVLYNYRNIDYVLGVLAIMKAGGTFVPIASDQPKDRVEYIISNSECQLVLTDKNLESQLGNISVPHLNLENEKAQIEAESVENLDLEHAQNDIAYVLYTSGSTGNPKGVLISNSALSNYIFWAKDYYNINNKTILPLFTSIGFDLTITSTILPLISGGKLMLYKENAFGPDMSLMQVLGDNFVNTIKLTPSHLSFLKDRDLSVSNIHTMIVGGEDFKVNLAQAITEAFGKPVKIYNEYGPTEATVGCIVGDFSENHKDFTSVPIGKPIKNMHAYILDTHKHLVPNGIVGELYLSGASLAEGYLKLDEITKNKFVDNPFVEVTKMYHTGDLARINKDGDYEYLGRVDEQVKLRGYRIELADIESNIENFEGVNDCAVVLVKNDKKPIEVNNVTNCTECGLPSNYPQTDFDEFGVCNLCNAFKGYKNKVDRYFKNEEELKNILLATKGKNPKYDCLSLLSGGKDSTYILAKLVSMGLKVLAFTLDNGYISNQAKANIDKIVNKLGVDHVYGETEHMNAIFVDSLKRHKNVCNGCFKAIYTLSTHIAINHQIPFIVTGLSRGQFFETRLTEELFWADDLDVKKIDDTILEVRKLYHKEKDAIKDLMDVSVFEDESTFDKVQFIDFYRYSDVSLSEMLQFLKEKVGWVRPTDTGRSTNCLINQVGIYVHKKQKGYSNYAFPYSWDVRLGHKTREETLDEINEYIHEPEVKRIMKEIGYEEPDLMEADEKLVAFYTGDTPKTSKEIKTYLSKKLPSYMMPTSFKYLDEIPLTKNGKVDKKLLRSFNVKPEEVKATYVAPRNEIEELLERIWKEVLMLDKIGVHDNFIALGGHSLAAIRVTSRVNGELEMELPLNKVFDLPTIEMYAKFIEETMIELLGEEN